MQRILIAIDDSAYSMKAAKTGFELAHHLQASIAVLYVIDKGKEAVNADLGVTIEGSRSQLRAEAERTIDQYIRMYDGIGQVFRFMPEGVPEKEIINIAREWKPDLIIMGTHGRSGLTRMVTGSVAEYVIRHAEVPVLVTPPHMK
ncbi:MAG TPA: universal stress protein [Puia sp.]|nr:universal stress protein [Puia sp.]